MKAVPGKGFFDNTFGDSIQKFQQVRVKCHIIKKKNGRWTKYSGPIQDRVNIAIDKKIPVGGGLGGGSSNASTILKGLSQLFNINSTQELLHTISRKIGADVAFFNNGGLQYLSLIHI